MEPIAWAIYADAKEKGALAESEGSSLNMRFRTFFAKEILDISEAKLQRLQSLTKLTEKARKAFDEGLIGKTVAAQMASLSPEEHKSRSWNRLYARTSAIKGNWIVEFKPWWRIPESKKDDDNPDIKKYRRDYPREHRIPFRK